jgi:hypothetical protein
VTNDATKHRKRETPREALARLGVGPTPARASNTPTVGTSTPTDGDRIAELLGRYHAGEYQQRPRVQARLAHIFATNPDDAEARLLTACAYLGVTGEHAAEAVNQAHELAQVLAKGNMPPHRHARSC